MNKKYFIFIFVLLTYCLVGTSTLTYGMHNLVIEDLGDHYIFNIDNSTSNLMLFYKPTFVNNYLNLSGNQNHVNLSKSLLKFNGLYDVYLKSGDLRYPLQDFNIFNFKADLSIVNLSINISSRNVTVWCDGKTNFNCEFEDIQSINIEKNTILYSVTRNQSYLQDAYKYVNSLISPTHKSTGCDYQYNDYSCGYSQLFGYVSKGVDKQSGMINSMLEFYKYTLNQSLLDIAINYASASNDQCNINQNDYYCNDYTAGIDLESQGLMMGSYLNLYEVTRNQTYLSIATSFESNIGLSDISPTIISSYIKFFKLTNSNTHKEYLDANKYSLNDYCWNNVCTQKQKYYFSKAYLDLYYFYDDNIFLQNYFNTIFTYPLGNTNCNSYNNITCINSFNSATESILLNNLFLTSSGSINTYDIKTDTVPNINENLNLSLSYVGNLNNLILYLSKNNEPSYSFSFNKTSKSFQLPKLILNDYGFYDYYFYDNITHQRFPSKTNYSFIISSRLSEYEEKAKLFQSSDPIYFCSTENGDFSCNFEHMQSGMIEKEFYRFNMNSSYSVNGLLNYSTTIIDNSNSSQYPSGRFSTCDHGKSDYECSLNSSIISDPNKVSGTLRLASLLNSLTKSYSKTQNITVRKILMNYAITPPEECDYFDDDYTCFIGNNYADTYYLSNAYLELYSITNIEKFKEIGINLFTFAKSNDNTFNKTIPLLNLYTLTQNTSYLDDLNTQLSLEKNMCYVQDECNLNQLYLFTKVYFDSYSIFRNESYLFAAKEKLDTKPNITGFICDPYNPDIFTSNCKFGHIQGRISSLFYSSYMNYIEDSTINYSVNLNSESSVDLYQLTNISCIITNTGNGTRYNDYLSLVTNLEVVNVSSNISIIIQSGYNKVLIEELSNSSSANITFVVNATKGGSQTNYCRIRSFSDNSKMDVQNIGMFIGSESNKLIYLYENREQLYEFKGSPTYDFNVEKVNLTIHLPSNISIVLNSSNNIETVSETVYTLDNLYYFEDLDFNLTFLFHGPKTINSSYILLNFTTGYGGFYIQNISLYFIDNISSISRTNSSQDSAYRHGVVDFMNILEFNYDKALTNVTLDFNYDVNITKFVKLDVNSLDSFSIINNSVFFNSLSSSIISINHSLIFNKSGTNNHSMKLFNKYGLNEIYNFSYLILKDNFDITKNNLYNLSTNNIIYLNLTSVINKTYENIILSINKSANIFVNEILVNYDNYSVSDQILLRNVDYMDNILINISFNTSNLYDQYVFINLNDQDMVYNAVEYIFAPSSPTVIVHSSSNSGGSSGSSSSGMAFSNVSVNTSEDKFKKSKNIIKKVNLSLDDDFLQYLLLNYNFDNQTKLEDLINLTKTVLSCFNYYTILNETSMVINYEYICADSVNSSLAKRLLDSKFGLIYVELPKDLIYSTNNITFLTNHTIIEEDPKFMLYFNSMDNNTILFTFNKTNITFFRNESITGERIVPEYNLSILFMSNFSKYLRINDSNISIYLNESINLNSTDDDNNNTFRLKLVQQTKQIVDKLLASFQWFKLSYFYIGLTVLAIFGGVAFYILKRNTKGKLLLNYYFTKHKFFSYYYMIYLGLKSNRYVILEYRKILIAAALYCPIDFKYSDILLQNAYRIYNEILRNKLSVAELKDQKNIYWDVNVIINEFRGGAKFNIDKDIKVHKEIDTFRRKYVADFTRVKPAEVVIEIKPKSKIYKSADRLFTDLEFNTVKLSRYIFMKDVEKIKESISEGENLINISKEMSVSESQVKHFIDYINTAKIYLNKIDGGLTNDS